MFPIIKLQWLQLRNKRSSSKSKLEEQIVEDRAISNISKTMMTKKKMITQMKRKRKVRSNHLLLIDFLEVVLRKIHLQSQLVEEEADQGKFNQRKNRAMMKRMLMKTPLPLSLKMKIDSGKIAALSAKELAVYYAAMDVHRSLIFLVSV